MLSRLSTQSLQHEELSERSDTHLAGSKQATSARSHRLSQTTETPRNGRRSLKRSQGSRHAWSRAAGQRHNNTVPYRFTPPHDLTSTTTSTSLLRSKENRSTLAIVPQIHSFPILPHNSPKPLDMYDYYRRGSAQHHNTKWSLPTANVRVYRRRFWHA